jgi:hypothetical protein
MPMQAARALLASLRDRIGVLSNNMHRARRRRCVNTSLSGTLFF